jgi:erythromycin esterase-like protein
MRVSWWEMRVRSEPSDAASSLWAQGTSCLAQVDEDRRVRLGQARRLGGVRDHTGSDDLVGALEGGPEDDIVEHARILVRAADLVTRSLDRSAGEERALAVRDRVMADAVARLMDDDPTSRVMVWAHNGHLAKGAYGGRVTASHCSTRGPHAAQAHVRRVECR